VWGRLGAEVAPATLNLVKTGLAFLMLAVVLAVLEGAPWPTVVDTGDLALLAGSGLVGLTVGDTAWFGALTRIGVRRSMLVASLVPVLTALGAWPLLDERPTAAMVIGIALTLAGVSMVVLHRPADDAGRRRLLSGVALAWTYVVCQSAGNLMVRLGGEGQSALAISVVRLGAGAAGLLLLGPLALPGGPLKALQPLLTRRRVAIVVGATFLGTCLGIWLYVLALTRTFAGVAATLAATGPLFAIVTARIIDREPVTLRAVAGAVVAVGGVAALLLR